MRPAALAMAFGLLLGATGAQAADSVWTRAAKPEIHQRDQLIAQVDTLMNEFAHLRRMVNSPAFRQPTRLRRAMVLRRARRLLEQAGAPSSTVPEVRLRLANIYELLAAYDGPERFEQAAVHFEWVARSENVHITARASALSSLAICLARMGDHRRETQAYDDAIALQPDPESHAVMIANQAEGHMAQGSILRAIRAYRAALAATPSFRMLDSGVTTLWGLAVALDRSGDLSGALENVERARSFDPGDLNINGPGWFYVPPYDEDWYAALGHWQKARMKTRMLADRVESYDAAIASWRSYMNRAPMTDRWLPLAAVRVKACEKERDRIGREQAKAPRGPAKDLRWVK